MDRRSLTDGREQARDLHDDCAASAIIDRGSSDPVSLKDDGFRRIDNGGADLDAGGRGGFGAREAGVDQDFLVGDDTILVLRTCRVVALVADDCADVASLANADEKLVRGERPFGDAAETLKPDESAGLDFPDDETERVHGGEQHHVWPVLVALRGGDQIAEPVCCGREAQPRHFGGPAPAHTAFVSTEAGDQHKLHRERAEALARRIGAGHWSPGYLPAPAVSPMTM